MTYFLAEITDEIVFIKEDDETLEFNTLKEAIEWAEKNLSFQYRVLKVVI